MRSRLGIGKSHTLINPVMDEKNKHSYTHTHISILLKREEAKGGMGGEEEVVCGGGEVE